MKHQSFVAEMKKTIVKLFSLFLSFFAPQKWNSLFSDILSFCPQSQTSVKRETRAGSMSNRRLRIHRMSFTVNTIIYQGASEQHPSLCLRFPPVVFGLPGVMILMQKILSVLVFFCPSVILHRKFGPYLLEIMTKWCYCTDCFTELLGCLVALGPRVQNKASRQVIS